MILLVCDHKKREIETLKKLKLKLNSRNIKAIIINKHCVIKAFNYYKPKIITFPHASVYLGNTIKILGNRVIKILIPTEHSSFVDKFLSIQYFGNVKSHKIYNEINKIDYIFTQSYYIKKFLINSTKLTHNYIFNTGHLFYNSWSYQKPKNKKIKKIGIALTNEYILRRYKDKNYLRNLFMLNNEVDLTQNNWRLKQINFDQYYFCLIHELIKRLSRDYSVELRTHTVDSESDFKFLVSDNVSISKNINAKKWIEQQDLIISTFSFINIDSYIFGKPHVSLANIIPQEFYYKLYETFDPREIPEINSIKPTNLDELMRDIKKIKFKKNNKLDFLLKKYFSFPYRKNPLDIASDELVKIFNKNKIKKTKFIMNKKEKRVSALIGKKFTFFISYFCTQIKFFLDKDSNNSYFDFLFFRK